MALANGLGLEPGRGSGRRSALAAAVAAGSLAAAAVMVSAPARAASEGPWTEVYNAQVRLVAGASGRRLLAGFEIRLASGWKTYWRNPGDSGGVPPHIDWSRSENLMGLEVLYPAPVRMPDPAGESIGYKTSVLLPLAVTPKDPAKPVRVVLDVEFGICKDICVPAEAKLDHVLSPGLGASPAIEAALAKVPRKAAALRPTDPTVAAQTAVLVGEKPQLTFEVAFTGTAVDAFIEAPDGIYVPMPQPAGPASGGRQRFVVDLASGVEPGDLKGKTVTLTLVSEAGASEIAWPIE